MNESRVVRALIAEPLLVELLRLPSGTRVVRGAVDGHGRLELVLSNPTLPAVRLGDEVPLALLQARDGAVELVMDRRGS